jgi:hypothetical protein
MPSPKDVKAIRIELIEFDKANQMKRPGPVGRWLRTLPEFDRTDSFAIFISAEMYEGVEIILYVAWSYRVGDQLVHADTASLHQWGGDQGFHLPSMATRIEYHYRYSDTRLKDFLAIPTIGPDWTLKAVNGFRFNRATDAEMMTYSMSLVDSKCPIYRLSERGLFLLRGRRDIWNADKIMFHGRLVDLKNEVFKFSPALPYSRSETALHSARS